MFNINKIAAQFDLKDLDAAKVVKILLEHQNSIIKAVLVIGSLLTAAVMFNNHRSEGQDLQTGISQLQQKIGAIKAREAAVRDLNNFKSSLPKKINEFQLITLISSYAKLYHVTISSLSPAESVDMGLYDVIDVRFEAVSDNFKNMVLFLRKIEKSRSPLRIDTWSGSAGQDGEITFSIQISAVLIHT